MPLKYLKYYYHCFHYGTHNLQVTLFDNIQYITTESALKGIVYSAYPDLSLGILDPMTILPEYSTLGKCVQKYFAKCMRL